MKTQVWSCGGGTQSAAIAALIAQGCLPVPDVSLMVDTEREQASTWAYMRDVLSPALLAAGIAVEIIRKSEFATVDLYRGDSLLLPVFTTQKGQMSKMPTFCSNEWKQRVARRYLRSIGVKQCALWMGMSLDEPQRVRDSDVQWIENRYPLIYDVPMRRVDCVALVESMGWPTPPRSACWMCPNMGNAEWREMKANQPGDFEKAVALEADIRRTDPHAFLHRSGVGLADVDFTEALESDTGNCQTGMCFV